MPSPNLRPGITRLSVELFIQISNDLDEDDLLALRMACQALNTLVKEPHLSAIYETRTVYLVPTSIDNLIKISRSEMNVKVRAIKICTSSPYINPERSIRKQLEIKENDPRTRDTSAGPILRMYEQSKADWPAVEHMSKFKSAGYGFTLAFLNLPNLRSIKFDWRERSQITRSTFNLFYPSVGLGPGKRLRNQLISAISVHMVPSQYDHTEFWSSVVLPVINSGPSRLESLSDTFSGRWSARGVKVDWFNMSEHQLMIMKSNFSNLHTLHLTIAESYNDQYARSYAGGAHYSGHGARGTRRQGALWRKPFSNWVTTLGANLRELLVDYMAANSTEILGEKCAMPLLPKLKVLNLLNYRLAPASWKDFLSVSKDLKEVKLSRCVTDEPKQGWFEMLKALKEETISLQKLSIDMGYNSVSPGSPTMINYHLPDLYVDGNWAAEDTVCKVTVQTNQIHAGTLHDNNYIYGPDEFNSILTKNIARELDENDHVDMFWDSLTDGNWKNGVEESRGPIPRRTGFAFDEDSDSAAGSDDAYVSFRRANV
ncbi:hypothetical protein ABW20_dc0108151 [Dactylellina cionopaga]|nr:hypothetical protein ABW20_dc0108151 [Dactylellina cionopaga]